MKVKICTTFFLALVYLSIHAQSSDWIWAKTAVGTISDVGRCVATDPTGNIIVAGEFYSPTITFGSITLTSIASDDIFIVKYDPAGNVIWAKSAGGIGSESGTGISTDMNGDVLVTGSFDSPTIAFDSYTVNNSGNDDIFVAKYDSSGNVLWAKSAGGNSYDGGNSICADANGNVLITGYFCSSSIIFGSTTLLNGSMNNAWSDFFVAKYDPLGNLLWAKSAGGTYDERAEDIGTDAVGNIFVTGFFESSTLHLDNITLTNPSFADEIFVVKYDTSGNVTWAKSAVGLGNDEPDELSIDQGGNILVTGYFYSSTITFGSVTLSLIGSSDLFIVKYDPIGNVMWAKSAGGISSDYGAGIATDTLGNILQTGWFESSSIVFGSYTLINAGIGVGNLFVTKYDASGNILWAKSAGGTGYDLSRSINVDPNGNVLVTGQFTSPTITFGSTVLTNTDSSTNFFIAKLDGTTGLAKTNNFEAIKTFPNPFSDQTTLYLSVPYKHATLVIYNSFGQSIKEINNISERTITLQRDNLPSGIYFIQIVEDNQIIGTNKLIITDK
jgi:ribosomal protein S11